MNYLNLLNHFNQGIGYAIVFLILFAESGLLIGFFLPGDSLVFPLGLLASQGHFSLPLLILISALGAVAGDSLGYYIGHRFGPALFQKEDSLLFKKEYVQKAHQYFDRYGKLTIIIARFVPIVRTFAPTVAGVANMEYGTFLAYNVVGGTLWATSLLLLGYYLGRLVPNIDRYLLPIIALIIVASLIGPLTHVLTMVKEQKKK